MRTDLATGTDKPGQCPTSEVDSRDDVRAEERRPLRREILKRQMR